jgi:hypothetical protein
MTISRDQKISIEKILTASLDNWDELLRTYNLFPSSDSRDTIGKIGWDILNHIAEMNKKYRSFVKSFPENFEIRMEVGNYVYDIVRNKIEEYPL